jgi:hypothetical protein
VSGTRLAISIAVVALAVALSGGPARADDTDQKAKAIALFDEGIKEMKAGNFAKACKAFEASNRLLPDSGTRGSLARCYTQLGRIASAWTLWRELSDTAPTPALRSDAAAQAKKLEPRLPKYTVKITAPAVGLTVTVDGQPIDLSLDVQLPIDPGTYAVEAAAPGRVAWQGQLTAVEGKTVEVEVPALEATSSGQIKQVKPGKPGKPGKPAKVAGGTPGRGRRIFGLVLTGVGVGGLVAGGVFGARASTLNNEAKDLCGGNIARCMGDIMAAEDKVDQARSAANISTVAFIAGGAVAATGLILFVTAPKGERRAVSIAPLVDGTTAGLSLSGRY